MTEAQDAGSFRFAGQLTSSPDSDRAIYAARVRTDFQQSLDPDKGCRSDGWPMPTKDARVHPPRDAECGAGKTVCALDTEEHLLRGRRDNAANTACPGDAKNHAFVVLFFFGFDFFASAFISSFFCFSFT